MQRVRLGFVVLIFLSLTISCGSGGGAKIPGDVVTSLSTCIDETCYDFQETVIGNYTLGHYSSTGAKELPVMNVTNENTKLSVTCSNEDSTEQGFVSFDCDLGNYKTVNAVCVHGEVALFNDGDTTMAGTGCQSISVYCDEYGFNPAVSCNNVSANNQNLYLEDEAYEAVDVEAINNLFESQIVE